MSASSNSTDSNAEDFPPFASQWKKPPGSRRASWRYAFQQTNPKPHSFQSDPILDSLKGASAPFSFQRRRARIDWRSLHTIDVDQIIRETDIIKLESVLDTVAFGDVQGEDTRNFTEANFVKLFRLSQLMVEYLLHMQESLVSHKTRLLEAGANLFKRAEKFRLRCVWQHEALWQTRRDLKRTKKAHYCPFCDKVFESASYLDMHISRRHSTSKEQPSGTKNVTGSSKSRHTLACQMKPVTTSALQTEVQSLHAASQVASLQMALKESNTRLGDVQQQLDNLQKTIQNHKPSRKDFGDRIEERKAVAAQEKLRELEVKFGDFEHQIKQLGQENSKLLKELNAAYSEVSGLKSEKRRFILSLDRHDEQVEEMQQEIEELRSRLKKDYTPTSLEKRPKAIKEWLHEAEDFEDKQNCDCSSRLVIAKRFRREDSQISRRTTAVTIDASTDAEDIPPDKEKWLRLHPYAPVANSPYALARYPHSPTLFVSKRNEVSRCLDKILREELKKFGIPPNAEGISDAKYAVVAAALEKQRAFRLSSAPSSEKSVMEYEKSTILWQIERAVHSRDMSILESIFDEETESASGNDGNVEDPGSEDDEILQSPSPNQSQRRGGRDLDFEGDLSGRRSMSQQGSEQSEVFARSRELSQLSDVFAISKNPLSRNNLDDLETRTFQVVGQLTTQRVPSLSDEQPQQCNLILSAVSSPTAIVPDHHFEHLEEDIGLGDWESDGEGGSSFAHSSPRRSAKDEHHDGASASSKNTGKSSDLDKRV